MKNYLKQEHLTTIFAILLVVLEAGIFDITPEHTKWIYLVAGILGAIGYSLPAWTKQKPEKSIVIDTK